MSELHPTFHVDMLMVLLMVAAAVAMVLKFIRLPYSIALVMVGLAIGIFHLLPIVEMTPDLILLIFLPALLFEASWNLDLSELKKNAVPIGALATVGVVISMLVVAAVMHGWGGLDFAAALLFGAMISATDPISVLALFRTMGIDKRLGTLLEGESLFNDGTAVVIFRLVLAFAISGGVFSLPATIGSFVFVVLGGSIVGVLIGFGASRLTAYFDDHLLEITLTTIVAYGSFLVAEHMHVSPVLAVVTAGIILGNYGSRKGMSATTRLAVNSFWEYAAFVVNSLVFLLIGLQVKLDLLLKYGQLIAVGILGILAARLVLVYGLSPILATKLHPIPWSWRHLLFWGAVRGSLSMALALSLPLQFEMRETLIIVTFGVVLFTLLVQGLTMEPLVRLLRMSRVDSRLKEYEALKAALIAEDAALEELNTLLKRNTISRAVYDSLSGEIIERQADLRRSIDDLHVADSSITALQMTRARRHILERKKDVLHSLSREQAVSKDVIHNLMVDLDHRIDMLGDDEEAVSTKAPAPAEQPSP